MNMEKTIKIAWWGLHFGEEEPFVEKKGAGTIFFTGCNLRCVYCQNYQISQQGIGKNYSLPELIEIMLKLQEMGALNIDLVTPTIWAKQIKEAIIEAKKGGLTIPILWNSNAYEDVEMLKEFEGLVDIYLPDFKYSDDELGFRYSGIKNYSKKASEAIREMHRQVGNLKLDEKGIAQKGIVVRHLILPNNIENSLKVLECIKDIDNNIYISLMSQYEPIHKAKDLPELNRIITKKELGKVFDRLVELGFENGWVQDIESHSDFLPDFTKENPFKK
ncbi:MAG: radical SAM protein [Candidatus Nealsonbacteria bacterium CG23_combo_of_CG06-09_8_20_14_all_39_17]|uniref:Radical SAM protein n=1 Tax=Candidatus Nealsonbacteria bacterium CG23_combo_of_CG06-09_8_20_14_all_39_17 TaxID=1974722 RepID=A0A2G9YV43_9BACT|nr:MAG: radical SAM protein [Candidatus Nealsonbacteria bacterium CG23_combo_of_CG06-09_8_20_14_all_39_17]PIU43750.1 MAG: radical SAM protein [Candidatus Nealsonbacteria bacterium CG07_land_8_20_14_0_80_39_13]